MPGRGAEVLGDVPADLRAGQAIEPAAAEFALSYHAAAMRVQRIKKKVRSRALELALQRGLTP